MPPKIKVTREEIVCAAVDILRQSGSEAINARSLAEKLNCSTQPIFTNFSSMEEVLEDVKASSNKFFVSYINSHVSGTKYPPYKAGGMAYISFARDEKELFKFLFMKHQQNNENADLSAYHSMIALVQNNLGVSREQAEKIHLQMWIYVHGIATMAATGYHDFSEEEASDILTDAFNGIKLYIRETEDNHE